VFDDGPDRETRDADGFPVAAHPQEWPLPNHDGQHSRRVPAAAPSGGDGLERSWRRSIEGYPEGLVAAGGRCFATVLEFQDSGEVLRTLAVDMKSGERLWNRATGPWPGGLSTSESGPLPGVGAGMCWTLEYRDDERWVSGLAAETGERQWSVPIGSISPKPLPAAGLLHVARRRPGGDRDDHEAVAVDPLSGDLVWRTDLPSGADRPVTDGTDLYYPGVDTVYRINPETGDRRGTLDRDLSGPVYADGRLFSYLFSTTVGDRGIAGVDPETGSVAWERSVKVLYTGDEGAVNAGYGFGGVADDRLLVIKDFRGFRTEEGKRRSDEVWALNPDTGETVWTISFEPPRGYVTVNRPMIAGSEVLLTGTVRIEDGDNVGFLERFDLETGASLARRELPAASDISPVVADGTILVACRDALLALR
jgi:outer membrane protein assembly factor BamB